MTIDDLYNVTTNFVFIVDDGVRIEYYGQDEYKDREIKSITVVDYPMYANVLEVEVK